MRGWVGVRGGRAVTRCLAQRVGVLSPLGPHGAGSATALLRPYALGVGLRNTLADSDNSGFITNNFHRPYHEHR